MPELEIPDASFGYAAASDKSCAPSSSIDASVRRARRCVLRVCSRRDLTCSGSLAAFVSGGYATPFRSGHYKRVLREMELAAPPALVPVNAPTIRKKGTFADPKLRVRFS